MTKQELIALILVCVVMSGMLVGFALLFLRYLRTMRAEVSEGLHDADLLEEYRHDAEPKVKKRRKTLRIVKRVVSAVAAVVVAAVLVVALCDKMGWLAEGSRSVVVVASGSMSTKHPDNGYLQTQGLDNQFPTYSMIVVEKVNPESLQKYDVIVYRNEQGVNIIHRIVRIERSSQGVRYVTKGDANNTEDTYHPTPEDVLGRYVDEYIPALGAPILFVQSPVGLVTVLALILGLVMSDYMRNKVVQCRLNRQNYLVERLALDEEKVLALRPSELQELYYAQCNPDPQEEEGEDVEPTQDGSVE